MDNNEMLVFQNSLGMVTNKRVVLKYKSGEEDIPIRGITSIAFRHKRGFYGFFGSLVGALAGIVVLFMYLKEMNGTSALALVGLIVIFVLAAIANWVGRHYLVIGTGNKALKPLRIEMAKTKEGKELYKALDKAVFS